MRWSDRCGIWYKAMRSVEAEGLDAFDLEMALELVVQGIVSEGVAFEGIAGA